MMGVRLDDLPEVLTPRDLVDYLRIGRDATYHLLHSGTIRSVRVGQKFLVPKAALEAFLRDATE